METEKKDLIAYSVVQLHTELDTLLTTLDIAPDYETILEKTETGVIYVVKKKPE